MPGACPPRRARRHIPRRGGIGTRRSSEFFGVRLLLSGFFLIAAAVGALCAAHSAALPDNLARELTQAERQAVLARNSPLTDYIFLSPNASFPRSADIRKLTVHHMAGDLLLEDLGQSFADADRRASANYGIDSRGRVALYVEEANRAWTSSSRENDDQAVTIEVANDELGGIWHVSDAAYAALVELCVDVCRRNGIQALTFTGDAEGTLTLHNMFYDDTECPGPYLEGRMGELAEEVNRRLAEGPDT